MKQQYIYELLKENNRIIIPNFGAFLVKDKKHSEIGQDAKNLNITFNDFLRFNDGVLVDYIAQKEKVNKIEAEIQVNEFVTSLKEKLNSEGSFEIKKVGKLIIDSSGKIKLSQLPVTKKPAIKKIKIEDTPVPEIKPVDEVIIENESKEPLNTAEDKTTETIPEKIKQQPIKPPVKEPVDYLAFQDKKRKESPWVLLTSVILIAIVVSYLLMYTDIVINNSGENKEKISPEQISENNNLQKASFTDSTMQTYDSALTSEESIAFNELDNSGKDSDMITSISSDPDSIVPDVIEETDNPENYFDGKYYHIIAASYPYLKGAEEFVAKLNSRGFHSRIVNKYKNHYRVSYDSYKSKDEALIKLKEIIATGEKDAWYLYYKAD